MDKEHLTCQRCSQRNDPAGLLGKLKMIGFGVPNRNRDQLSPKCREVVTKGARWRRCLLRWRYARASESGAAPLLLHLMDKSRRVF